MGRPKKMSESYVPKPTDAGALKGAPYQLSNNLTADYLRWRQSTSYGRLSYGDWRSLGRPA